MAGCVSSTQNTSTSSPVKSSYAPGDIDEIWKGSNKVGDTQAIRVTLELIKNGATLTGNCIWGKDSMPILDGKIAGNKYTFRTKVLKWASSVETYHEGTVDGDKLKLISKYYTDGGVTGKMEAKLRRVN